MNRLRRVRALITGGVQGVGFRYFCQAEADRFRISGWARNLPNGDVELEAQSDDESTLQKFLEAVKAGPPGGRVANCTITDIPPETSAERFGIRF